MVNYILNDRSYESRKSDKTIEAERIVITASKFRMAEIREINYDNFVYPLPSSLRKFLEVLILPEIR